MRYLFIVLMLVSATFLAFDASSEEEAKKSEFELIKFDSPIEEFIGAKGDIHLFKLDDNIIVACDAKTSKVLWDLDAAEKKLLFILPEIIGDYIICQKDIFEDDLILYDAIELTTGKIAKTFEMAGDGDFEKNGRHFRKPTKINDRYFGIHIGNVLHVFDTFKLDKACELSYNDFYNDIVGDKLFYQSGKIIRFTYDFSKMEKIDEEINFQDDPGTDILQAVKATPKHFIAYYIKIKSGNPPPTKRTKWRTFRIAIFTHKGEKVTEFSFSDPILQHRFTTEDRLFFSCMDTKEAFKSGQFKVTGRREEGKTDFEVYDIATDKWSKDSYPRLAMRITSLWKGTILFCADWELTCFRFGTVEPLWEYNCKDLPSKEERFPMFNDVRFLGNILKVDQYVIGKDMNRFKDMMKCIALWHEERKAAENPDKD